jgi:hypothetical protein
MEIGHYITTVENGIKLLGVNPEEVRTEEFAHWSLSRGSAEILMFLRNSESMEGEKPALVIMSKIMDLPAVNRELIFETVLKYNFIFVAESFCVESNALYLKTSRFAHGIDPEEVMILLDNLSAAADHLDDELQRKFKGFSMN